MDDFAHRLGRSRTVVRLGYVGIVLLATLSYLDLDLDAARIAGRVNRMLQPTISRRDVIDGARNVVLFAGWGLLWMVTAPPGRSWRALASATLTGVGLSVSVEAMQLLSETRRASVLDIVTNSAGSLLGALVLVIVVRGLAGLSTSRSFVGLPASVFAIAYGAASAGEAFVPLFRQSPSPAARGGPFERLATVLEEFRWESLTEPPLGDFLLFLPAGVLAVAALVEPGRSYRSSAVTVGLAGAVAALSLELAHGMIGIDIHAGAVLTHAAAVACGGWIAAAGLPAATQRIRGVDRPRLLTGGYAVVLLLWALRPYRPETGLSAALGKLTTEWWIPMRSLGQRVDAFSVVDVFDSFLLYLPLGALLAVWPLGRRGTLAAFAPAIYLAVCAELAQILVLTRTLDVTDLMVQASGAAVGWVVARRAGYRPYGAQITAG